VRATALAPELTIREAGELQQRLLALLDGGGAVRLDASGVTLIDTAGLQLLAALATGLRVEGRELQWAKVSDTLRDAAQRTGLSQPLGIDG
jgi:anti-anti-sigma regulatory factor